MDEKKAYGVLVALGTAVGNEAKADDAVIAELRAIPDAGALEDFLMRHRGNLPEGLVREFLAATPPAEFQKTKSKLVLQAKMVVRGDQPVSAADARKGPVKHR